MTEETPAELFGGPTKRFFVSMLTRDIELDDAILDLVDNCIDGAMRTTSAALDSDKPYAGFRADLTVTPEKFEISDNCGGIPSDYIEEAFQLGRPNIKKDGDLPTVGMYGIGMKRAIFKMGKTATVFSNADDGAFHVDYSAQWLNPENTEWTLPISRQGRKNGDNGVRILVSDLKDEISKAFSNKSFLNRLMAGIQDHFGYLMQKGFEVSVNGVDLVPKTLGLYTSAHSGESEIRPFDYSGLFDSVEIRVTVGFFRALVREAEIDKETEAPVDAEAAGISVVCNDRVILLGDRTIKTGWGDAGVPRYHPQFRSIAGLIEFRSNDAEKLPISTTKRGLDAGSDVYFAARKAVTEGLKTFTSFTNRFKGIESEANEFFAKSARSDVKTTIRLAQEHGTQVRGANAKKYVPVLPEPTNKESRKRISFIRPDDEVRAVSEYLFQDSGQQPSIVGAECFDRFLKEARK
ncbi:ATP-binding protein [Rhodophyticola porphyridii]|uniref:ATP-binding protein n=1 Tax=Rhodophyticola porphyridii TaxID=1852017 RepID=A0A3L9Y2X5_9RHOB|nr:ATP-binding protein [Rhodophyticola porphyridii]RMA41805.1 ATP-binding protein [Rhodophyticola porphyridii]